MIGENTVEDEWVKKNGRRNLSCERANTQLSKLGIGSFFFPSIFFFYSHGDTIGKRRGANEHPPTISSQSPDFEDQAFDFTGANSSRFISIHTFFTEKSLCGTETRDQRESSIDLIDRWLLLAPRRHFPFGIPTDGTGAASTSLIFVERFAAAILGGLREADLRGSRGGRLLQVVWWPASQSRCWQKEPQYRAIPHPPQVSRAGLPQFQQLWKRDENSCTLGSASFHLN